MAKRSVKKIKQGFRRGGRYAEAARCYAAKLVADRKLSYRKISPFLRQAAAADLPELVLTDKGMKLDPEPAAMEPEE